MLNSVPKDSSVVWVLKKMATTLETVFNNAKVYAETGKISQAKEECIAQLAKKTKRAA